MSPDVAGSRKRAFAAVQLDCSHILQTLAQLSVTLAVTECVFTVRVARSASFVVINPRTGRCAEEDMFKGTVHSKVKAPYSSSSL